MKLLMMIAADYATFDPATGKLHILGLFRQIEAKQFPVVHPRICFVVKIEGDLSDKPNSHKLNVTLTDDDGEEIVNVEGPFDMPDSIHGISPECDVVMELNGLTFRKPGQYRFFVRLNDGEVEGSTAIQIIQKEI